MTTILNGLLGGLVGGTVAAFVTSLIADDPSVAEEVLRRAAGSNLTPSRRVAVFAQISYGGLAGGTLVALELFVLGVLAVPPTSVEAFSVAGAWSALLFGILLASWRFGPWQWVTSSQLGELLIYHLVYGLGLGGWIRLTWIT